MKKILFILIIFLFISLQAKADTIFVNDWPYIYFKSDVDPTSSESIVTENTMSIPGLFYWWNTSENTIFININNVEDDLEWECLNCSIAKIFNNSPSHSIVTTAAAANGFQISSTRDSFATYSITITTAVQIGITTNVEGYVVLEIASTNSSNANDWIEISRVSSAQNIGLAIALSSTNKTGGVLNGIIPAGYYTRLRSINTSGTPTYAYNSGQEVLL